jgi:purine-cytosine permease-like protein
VSFLNLFPRWRGKWVTILFGLSGTLLALVFPMERYEAFLLFIGAIFVPLFGVVLFDYFLLRRRHIDLTEVIEGKKAVGIQAIFAWVIGVGVYLLFWRFFAFLGASLPSFFAAGIGYVLFKRGLPWRTT